MNLLDLPTELIVKIIEDTIPESIENVLVTCSRFYCIGAQFLEEHNKLRRRYRNFKFSRWIRDSPRKPNGKWDETTAATGMTIRTVADLLGEIVKNPLIGRYIRCADLSGDLSMGDGEWGTDGEMDRTVPRIKCDHSDLRDLVYSSTVLEEAGIDREEWLTSMHEYALGHADVFLFSLLPNVVRLNPPGRWGDLHFETPEVWTSGHVDGFIADDADESRSAAGSDDSKTTQVSYGSSSQSPREHDLWPVLDVLLRRANNPNIPSAALSKLAVVGPSTVTDDESRLDLAPFTFFLGLDSVREFYGGSCVADNEHGSSLQHRYPCYGKSLEKLEFVGCTINVPEMNELLSRLKHCQIKQLHYAHEIKWHGCGYDWDSGAFINVIQKHLGSSLEELSIYAHQGYGQKGRTVTTLDGFPRLKTLDLDLELLLGPAFDEKDTEYDIHCDPELLAVEDLTLPPLVDLLPRSIETVRFFVRGESSEHVVMRKTLKQFALNRLFERFEEDRHSRLSNLKEVVIEVEPECTSWVEGLNSDVVAVVQGKRPQPRYIEEFFGRFEGKSKY